MSIGGPYEVLPPHDRSGCMITASEVSKKPGAVQDRHARS